MTPRRKFVNPFYVLVVIVGIAFTVTACAYGVMTVRGLRPELSADGSGENLMTFLDRHGFRLMLIELGALAVFAAAAMITDTLWSPSDERPAQRLSGSDAARGAASPSPPQDSTKANERVTP